MGSLRGVSSPQTCASQQSSSTQAEPDKPPKLRIAAASWLGGARSAGVELGYPGQRLGLPQQGPGSVVRWSRRLAAFGVDWLLCAAIAVGLLGDPAWSTPVFLAQAWVFTALIGASAGQVIMGVQVVRLADLRPTGRRPAGAGWKSATARTLLLGLLIPALVWDRDQRGLHDLAAGTVAVRR